jgi:hypothetical protein
VQQPSVQALPSRIAFHEVPWASAAFDGHAVTQWRTDCTAKGRNRHFKGSAGLETAFVKVFFFVFLFK